MNACPAWSLACAAAVILLGAIDARGQDARNVLLVVNRASAASSEIGEYYARVRGVPDEQIVRIATPVADEVHRALYELQIEAPLAGWLNRHAAHDRILYIVLTKGVPLRVAGTPGRDGTLSSVDSELALLYRKMSGAAVPPQGSLSNPYFLGESAVATARPFTHADHDLFLVTRLDGFTVQDVKAAIDRAVIARDEGRIVLDARPAVKDRGNAWMEQARDRLAEAELGERVVLERSSREAAGFTDVLGYFSWGSNDPAIPRRTGLGFVPGAIGARYLSTDARTFTAPPDTWKTGTWEQRNSYYAGSPQSLAGDLIREGITGLGGYVGEPFLDGSIRPDILFPAYLAGFSLSEAFYLAMPSVSWRAVVLGDPLCRIRPGSPIEATDLAPPTDPETEMPEFYTRRWLAAASRLVAPGQRLRLDGLKASLRAQGRLAREDVPGAREALEEATKLEPRLTGAQLLLASLYEGASEFDRAVERYHVVLSQKRDDVVALNNLAYHLAAREQKPQEALALAERARLLAPGSASVADTLAWVHHLLGDHEQASRHIADAVRLDPTTRDVLVHAAIIFEAAGRRDVARRALEEALKQNPALDRDERVRELRVKLSGAR